MVNVKANGRAKNIMGKERTVSYIANWSDQMEDVAIHKRSEETLGDSPNPYTPSTCNTDYG